MGAELPFAAEPEPTLGEYRVQMHGVSWARYLALRALLDEQPGVRLTFLEGTLEIMTPSPEHERTKTLIARLIEAYSVQRQIPLNGYGSTTFSREAQERGLEPDECYVLGSSLKTVPDIAIEVVITSGGIDKLAVYRGLGIPEVWFFHGEAFHLYRLGDTGYERVPRSTFLPDLDLDLLASFVDRQDQTAAVRDYQSALDSGE